MKIILLQDVKSLGTKGTVKDVNEGYFRNFLAPRKLASKANESEVRRVRAQQEKAIQKLESMKESAEAIKNKIDGKTLEIKEKASESGKLYAAVSTKEVAEALKDQLKVEVPASAIEMKDSIKTEGTSDLTVKLHKDIKAKISVNVTAE